MHGSRVLCLLVGLAAPAMATGVLYVDSRADGNGSGTSWANAYNDLQDALDDAHEGMEIWVAGGPYVPNRDPWGKPNGRHDTFTVRGPDIKVFGGFLGHEKSRQERNAFGNQTVLAGEAEKYHVVTIDSFFGAGASTVFDGFIVTGGMAEGDGKGGDDLGGGMVIYDAGVVLANCWFVANHANGGGGGLKISAEGVRIVNCQFSDNSSGYDGFEGQGGGILSFGGTRLVNCLFHANFAGIDGRGHAASFWTNIEGDPARLENCTVTDNGPIDPTGLGAIEIDGVLIVRNSVIWGNRTENGAPIAFDEQFDIVSVSSSDIEGGFAGDGNIAVDPRFASSFAESFRLIKASPCTDFGNAGDLPEDFGDVDQDRNLEEVLPLDLELTPRIHGPGLNLGCFETFDCQANNIGDILDFAAGTSHDCDENDIPDECDIRDCQDDPFCGDCNENQQLDGCESDDDCNANGTPDLCELAENPALDCDADGQLDSCQGGFRDCNSDGVADFCQPELNVDTDGDGVIDCIDNCPSKGNADQLDGDNDGAGDACDSLLSLGPCPAPITAGPETIEGAHVPFELPAVQNAFGAVVLTATPPSGSLFPIGATTVVIRATDEGGGDVSCSFQITVLEPKDDSEQDGDCPPLYRMTSGAAGFFGLPIGCGPGCLVSISLTLAGLAGVKWRRSSLGR